MSIGLKSNIFTLPRWAVKEVGLKEGNLLMTEGRGGS